MAEYIDRNELIKRLETSINSWGRDCNSNAPTMVRAYQDVLHRVKSIPTADVVEVVRCKDCKYFGKNKEYRDTKFSFSFCDKFHHNITTENDFCSFGERKEGDGE